MKTQFENFLATVEKCELNENQQILLENSFGAGGPDDDTDATNNFVYQCGCTINPSCK